MATNAIIPGAARPAPLFERINAMERQSSKAMTCPVCGGAWFYKITVEQFSDSGYGSAQFRSLSMSPESAYICLCGELVEIKEATGRGIEGSHAKFIQAVKDTVAWNKRTSVQGVAEACASLEEVQELATRVKWLEDVIETLTTDQTPIEEDAEELETGTATDPLPTSAPAPTLVPAAAPIEKIAQPARTGRRPKPAVSEE